MTDTDDPASWLRTTLDGVEQRAKAALWAGNERWEVLAADDSIRRPWQVIDGTYNEGLMKVEPHAADDEGVARHVAFWDPVRVLRLVEAARRILDEHPTVPEDWATDITGDCQMCAEPAPCPTLRLSAMWLDDQPGYLAGWKPS